MVAAFGFDRPEGHGGAQNAAVDASEGAPRVHGGLEGSNASDARTTAALNAIALIHQREQFGDCVDDGDPWPCKTMQVLAWLVSDVAS